MAVYSTFATDVQYGPWQQAKLDVYKHPAGTLSGGNVCIVFCSAGGWNGNDKSGPGAGTRKFDLFNYLPNHGVTTGGSNVPVNWISVAYPSGGTASSQRASFAAYFPIPIIATQMAVQHVRSNATSYGINPGLVYGFGDSAGATNLTLAHFWPSAPYFRSTQPPSQKYTQYFSSRLNGVINMRGQMDYRAVGGTPTMDWTVGPQKLFGVGSNAELAALNPNTLAAASVIAQVQANRAENKACHVLSFYEEVGTHVIPYNAHDSAQLANLHNALDIAGVDNTRTTPFPVNDWQPGSPNADTYSAIAYSWLMTRRSALISGAEPSPV